MQLDHLCGAGIVDVNHPPSKLVKKSVKKSVVDYVRSNPLVKRKTLFIYFRPTVLNYYFAYIGKRLALEETHNNDLLSYHHFKPFCKAVVECKSDSTGI